MQDCPHCGKPNPDTDAYCYSCGHVLPAGLESFKNPTARLDDETYRTLEPRRRWGTAYFTQENRLQLTFRDTDQVLIVAMIGELVVGRAHAPSAAQLPDIDLTAYGAEEKGVSRRHLKLIREQETITVEDLGSANGTYLNGQRLVPHEARILRDGDELRMGRLVIRVAFV